MKTKILFAAAIVLIPFYSIAQHTVDFESMPVGTQFGGPPLPNFDGQVVFTENLIPVSVHDFYWDVATTHFGFCEIVNALPDFGNGQIMSLNNINLKFDFTQLPYQNFMLSFEFADLGGFENLQINGQPVIIDDMSQNAPGHPAPGVTLYISTITIPGGYRSRVLLYGTVTSLLIGGQEFFLDDIQTHTGGGSLYSSCVDFESQPMDAQYGGPPATHSPGDFIFAENNIPVTVHDFYWEPGVTHFGFCTIQAGAGYSFGTDQVMFCNNINLNFDLTHLGNKRAHVTLQFGDLGGMENLVVNGAPMFIGELQHAPGNPAPDISWYISRDVLPGGMQASVILFGNVDHLLLGGQEFLLDNICAYYTMPNSVPMPSDAPAQPHDIALNQNYPNPFNPGTNIQFALDASSIITLKIYNSLGHEIFTLADGRYQEGVHSIRWDGVDENNEIVPSGIYFYKLTTGDFSQVRKMILIR